MNLVDENEEKKDKGKYKKRPYKRKLQKGQTTLTSLVKKNEDVKLAISKNKTNYLHFSIFFETRNFRVNIWCPSRTFFSEKVNFVNIWCRKHLVPGGVYGA